MSGIGANLQDQVFSGHLNLYHAAFYNTHNRISCQAIEANSVPENTVLRESRLSKPLNQQLQELKRQRTGLRKMRALEDISREEFLQDYEEINTKIASLKMKIQDLESSSKTHISPNIDLSHIKRTLSSWIDTDAPNVPDILIEQFIRQVTVVDDNTFCWILNFPFPLHKSCKVEKFPFPVYLKSGQKLHRFLGTDFDNAKPRSLFSFTVTKDEARAYCRLIGIKFIGKNWLIRKLFWQFKLSMFDISYL